jgi:hypothetical protein
MSLSVNIVRTFSDDAPGARAPRGSWVTMMMIFELLIETACPLHLGETRSRSPSAHRQQDRRVRDNGAGDPTRWPRVGMGGPDGQSSLHAGPFQHGRVFLCAKSGERSGISVLVCREHGDEVVELKNESDDGAPLGDSFGQEEISMPPTVTFRYQACRCRR